MAKSKVRGGVKAHRKKVEARNQQIKAEQSAMQKLMNEAMKTQIEELKKKYQAESGATTNPA
jgi:DNA-binding FrmR family transcriptional regulator